MAKWVQYKNDPTGQKWEVYDEIAGAWLVKREPGDETVWRCHELPMREYVECAPPERWDVATTTLVTDRQLLLITVYPFAAGVEVALDLPVNYKFERVDANTFRILKKVLDSPKQP